MPTETVTVKDLVDRTLDVLHRHSERAQVRTGTLTGTALSASDTTGMTSGTLLEVSTGYELMRVSQVSSAVAGTVARGYLGTPQAGNGTFALSKDPTWTRHTVLRALSDVMATLHGQVPLLRSTEVIVATDEYFLDLSALTDLYRPLRVGMLVAGHWVELPGWDFVEVDALADYPGLTRFVTLPQGLAVDDKVVVTYQATYGALDYISPPADADTVTLPLGARDLPPLRAAARLLSNREVSRAEIEKVEEWNQEAAIRGGWTLRAVNQLWQEYYRSADEVVRTVKASVPKHRPYRKMRTGLFSRGL